MATNLTPEVDNGRLVGSLGDDNILLNAGQINYTLFPRGAWLLAGNDTLTGSSDNDRFVGNRGNDSIDGGGGADLILASKENDTIAGGDGNDSIRGDNDNDVVVAGAGADILRGGKGNDSLFASSGSDTLVGDLGIDILDGKTLDPGLDGDLLVLRADEAASTVVFANGALQADVILAHDIGNDRIGIGAVNNLNDIVLDTGADVLGTLQINIPGFGVLVQNNPAVNDTVIRDGIGGPIIGVVADATLAIGDLTVVTDATLQQLGNFTV